MTRARSYLLTINNPDSVELAQHSQEKYAVWQKERGEQGTEHLQIYIQMRTAVRISSVKDLYPRAHIEVARSPAKAMEYCSKEDTRIEGPWERGEKPQQGARTDIEECVDQIMSDLGKKRPLMTAATVHTNAMAKFHRGIMHVVNSRIQPRDGSTAPDVTVLYGKTGTGKSKRAFEECPDAYVWDASKSQWFDGYMGHNEIIMEEFRGQMPFGQLLRLLDRYELQLPVKGSFVEIVATKIIITSPVHPREWYTGLDERLEGSTDQLLRRITNIVCLDEPALPHPFRVMV